MSDTKPQIPGYQIERLIAEGGMATSNMDETLKKIAITSMTGKSAESVKDLLAAIAVKAVKSIMGSIRSNIRSKAK